jgi:hypothetical protein
MRFLFSTFFVLLFLILSSLFSQAAVTLPDEPVEEHPVDMILPRDFPLPVSEQVIAAEGLKLLVFGDSGTGDEIQIKVARG